METTTLEARIANPAFAVPGATDALVAINKAISRVGISERTLELMHLRATGTCRSSRHRDVVT